MNIAILGYGKMGKEIEKIALDREHNIGLIIDIDNQHEFTVEKIKSCDVAIDFSIPSSAYNNIITCFEAGTPIVSGTTGWLDKYDEITQICKDKKGSFFYASNFSLGVNIFFNINRKLANIMNKFKQYDVSMEETHHTQKLDAPSGTAISLANEGDEIIFRDISLWEIAMLIKKERVRIDIAYQDFINLVLSSNKYVIHRITPEIAELSVNLPAAVNKDPADRIIAATSIINNAPLVTKDENLIRSAEITVIW